MKKKSIEFPVVKGRKTCWPSKSACPICGKDKKSGSMAILNTGALLMTNRKTKSGGMSEDLDGFMTLIWHGAHGGGEGGGQDVFCSVDIVRGAVGGQADLHFCSTACLRRFLNDCVDELDSRMAAERKTLKQNTARRRRTPAPGRGRRPGALKGKIWMSGDFDEPLGEFKGHMG